MTDKATDWPNVETDMKAWREWADGVSLTSIKHPAPKSIWARLYWWFRSRRGISESSIETVEIDMDP